MNKRRVVVPLLVFALGACDAPEPPVSPNTVARAAGIEFTVDQAAEILVPQTELPNQPMVVDALANLWVDYFLLARTTAEDSTLSNLDLTPLIEMNVDQELVFLLREEVIEVDTTFTEAELRQIYESELPGARVRARHILLRVPIGATGAQEDSVRALGESLRNRIIGGENFALLAGEFSLDPGSAANGGDLGSFARGEMVPAFEEVAFSLEVGDVSPLVETSFGLHLIRVDERIIPPIDENLEQFRLQLQNRRVMEAESTFVADIVDNAGVEVQSEEFGTARQMALDPDMELTRQALNRTLVKFDGGTISLRDYQDWIQLRAMGLRNEIRSSSDEQLEGLMRNLARERLLVNTANERGVEISQALRDSMSTGIRDGVKTVVGQMGFGELAASDPTTVDSVAHEAVMELLHEAVTGGREVIPLGGVAIALRRQYNARVFGAALERAVTRITELRSQLPLNPPGGELSNPAQPVTQDSAGPTGGSRNP